MEGERRYGPHGDAVELDSRMPESIARQLEAIAAGAGLPSISKPSLCLVMPGNPRLSPLSP
jgi:hypothetical protein